MCALLDAMGWCSFTGAATRGRDGKRDPRLGSIEPVSRRPVYSGLAEVSLYVATGSRGRGVGKALLAKLVEESEKVGIWSLQASTFPENLASRAIHKICGFREVGTRERVAKRDGIWRDTILLERRSRLPQFN
jgi:L-amino acid N-acyltransferase YncA